jgi:murein DD-endopeptidase MepM/ murein hydrolase activator NlpD
VINSRVDPDCDVPALITQYENDPLYDYEIDPDSTYEPGDFAECAFAYGEPIVAAAAGAVVHAHDGSPNNFPVGTKLPELYLESSDPDKIPGGGNAVVINHGNGEYTFYAHMRPGSVQVSVGQQVTAGQLLGEVGNTGSSSGSHLHFHLMESYIPAPSGPPGLAQPGGGSPGHGMGLPIYFYEIAFPAGGAEPPLRQLRRTLRRRAPPASAAARGLRRMRARGRGRQR